MRVASPELPIAAGAVDWRHRRHRRHGRIAALALSSIAHRRFIVIHDAAAAAVIVVFIGLIGTFNRIVRCPIAIRHYISNEILYVLHFHSLFRFSFTLNFCQRRLTVSKTLCSFQFWNTNEKFTQWITYEYTPATTSECERSIIVGGKGNERRTKDKRKMKKNSRKSVWNMIIRSMRYRGPMKFFRKWFCCCLYKNITRTLEHWALSRFRAHRYRLYLYSLVVVIQPRVKWFTNAVILICSYLFVEWSECVSCQFVRRARKGKSSSKQQ